MRFVSKNSLFFIFGLSLVFFAVQSDRPLVEDEAAFAKNAYLWASAGPNLEGLWHTPFYLEALVLWQKIFGFAEPGLTSSIRILKSFGIVCSLITAGILFVALRIFCPQKHWLVICSISLFLVHPYFIQSGLLLDIDNTILMPVLLLWLVVAEIWDRSAKGNWVHTIVLSLIISIALMIKEITPMLFLGIWVAWALMRRWRYPEQKLSPHLTQAVVGSVLALLLFISLLWLWAELRGFHWLDPLRRTLSITAERGQLPWVRLGFGKWIYLVVVPFLWLGVPLLFFLVEVFRIATWEQVLQKVLHVPLGIWAAILTLVFYSWVVQGAYYFPKYSAPILPMLILGIGMSVAKMPIDNELMRAPIKKEYAFIFLSLLCIGLVSQLDPLAIVEYRRELTSIPIAIALLGFLLTVGAMWYVVRKPSDPRFLYIASIAYCIGISSNHAIVQDRTVGYLYGEYGLGETIVQLKKLTAEIGEGVRVLTPYRDIEWLLPNKVQIVNVKQNPFHINNLKNQVVVTRTYGNQSLTRNNVWMNFLLENFNCYVKVDAKNARFEWWWNKASSQQYC